MLHCKMHEINVNKNDERMLTPTISLHLICLTSDGEMWSLENCGPWIIINLFSCWYNCSFCFKCGFITEANQHTPAYLLRSYAVIKLMNNFFFMPVLKKQHGEQIPFSRDSNPHPSIILKPYQCTSSKSLSSTQGSWPSLLYRVSCQPITLMITY